MSKQTERFMELYVFAKKVYQSFCITFCTFLLFRISFIIGVTKFYEDLNCKKCQEKR